MSPNGANPDVVVVGARIAGASTALHLARQGLSVLVLERAEALGPTMSSHQMNIVASECLRDWGLYGELLASDCPGIREIVFDIGDVSITTAVPAIGAVDQLHYCKRKVLDNILLRAAQQAGARVEHGSRFCRIAGMDAAGVELEVEDGQGVGRRLRTRFLVGADGRMSSVARALQAAEYDVMPERAIMCFGYYGGRLTDKLEIFMRNTRSVALFPTNDGETCAVVAHQLPQQPGEVPDKTSFLQSVVESIPTLHDKLRHCTAAPRVYRFSGAPSYFRQPYAGRCALVGDAGYFRDPIVGDGIADAMLGAELLALQIGKIFAGAPHEAALAAYQQVRDGYFRPAYERTRKMLRFEDDFEGLNRQVARAAAGPAILRRVFDRTLAGNRRTRRDLFGLLEQAEKAAA